MGFELEKRLASELNRFADEASQDRDVPRPTNKHVERLKQIAAELQAKLRGEHGVAEEAPGKRSGVDDIVASAVRRLEDLGKRTRGFDQLPWQQTQRATFDDYRTTGLREVLARLSDRKLRGATLASAEPAIGARTGQTTKAAPNPAGQAMWRAAERRAATLYRHAMDGGEVAGEDPIVDEALDRCGNGQPLPLSVRKQMEAELGISLARVRVHTDPVAAAAAKAVRAEAFTVGEDIFFADGLYAPTSREGQKLLAHELTHVVQSYQGRTATGGSGIKVSQPGESLEREADAVADRVTDRASQQRPQRRESRAEQSPRARGSSPALTPVVPAPVIAPVTAARGATLNRRPAAENSSARDAEGPNQRTQDPNKRGTLPNLLIERDHSGERTTRDAKKGADPMKDGAKKISAQVNNAVSGAVSELKSTAKSVKSKGVGKQAKALAKQHGKTSGDHKKEAQKVKKAAGDAAKKTATPAKTKSGGAQNGKQGGGDSGPVKFKPISDWNKYMPAELPDQDPRERKRILGLVKEQVNGDRQQSGGLLNQLRKAQVAEAKQVRGMLPGLQSSIRSGQAAAVGKVNGAEAAQCGAVQAAIAGVTAQVRSTAAAMMGQINAAHTAALNTIRDAKQDAVQKLTEAKTTALSDIDTAETSQIAIVNAQFLATKTAIIAAGAAKATEASGRGDSYPLSYDGDKLEAARKAAREVAAEYAKAMPGEATKAFEQIDAERPKTISDIRKMATDQRKQVNDAFTQCKQTITDAATQATTAAGEMQSGAISQVQSTMSTTTSQLAAHGASQTAAIRQQASGARSGIQKAGAAALTSVADGVSKAAAGLEKGAKGLVKGAHQVEAPSVDETKQRVTDGMQQVGEAGRQIGSSMQKSVTGTVAGLTQQATGAVTGMTQTATQAKASAQQMGQGASQAMTQIGQGSSQGLQQLGENLKKSTDDIAGKGKEAMKGVVVGLREAFSTATQSLGDGLRGAVENVKSSFAEAVLPAEDAAIAENAKKAADAVKPWWQKALAFVVSIVVAIVVVVVITALIVTTGPVGAILVGAAAGALGSVLGQMASNLVLGNGLMDGVTWQTVAMGAVGGAVGAGFTSAITAGAQRFGATAVTSALKGGTGAGAFAIRTGVGVTGDLVSDAATQLIFTGGYEFSMENLATSLVTNAVSSTNRYDSVQDGFQNSIRSRAGHIEVGRPGGGGLNLSTSAHAPGAPITNAAGGGTSGAHVDGPAPAGPTGRGTGGGDSTPAGSRTGGDGNNTAPRGDAGGNNTAPRGGDQTPQAGGDRTNTTGGDRTNTTGGDRTNTTGGDRTNTTGGDRTNTTGGDRTQNTGGDRTQTGGDRTTDGTQPTPDGQQGGQVTRRTGGDDSATPARRTDGADNDGQQARGDRDANTRTDGDQDAGSRPSNKRESAGGDKGGDDGPPPATHDQGGDTDGGNAPHGDGGDTTPDGPESAAAGDLAELGYPNPTRANADRAAAAIESGNMPPRDTIRDTAANQQGVQELQRVNSDPTLTPESKTNIRRDVANQLRADEPTGNLPRDVQQARAAEEARVATVKAQEQKAQEQTQTQDQTPGTPEGAQGPEIKPGTERTRQVDQDAFEALPPANKHDVARGEIESGARVFDSQEAAATWARTTLENDVTQLPAHLQQSVNNYTNEKGNNNYDGPTYREMNGVLRADAKGEASTHDTPQVRQDIANVNEAMARNKLPEAVTVVRGSGHGHLDATHPADLVGTTMTEAGYLSTSLGDNGTVAAFADKEMILHLHVPAGQEAMWVEPVGAFGGGERELLLGRGTSWTVNRAFVGDDGKWHVYGRVN